MSIFIIIMDLMETCGVTCQIETYLLGDTVTNPFEDIVFLSKHDSHRSYSYRYSNHEWQVKIFNKWQSSTFSSMTAMLNRGYSFDIIQPDEKEHSIELAKLDEQIEKLKQQRARLVNETYYQLYCGRQIRYYLQEGNEERLRILNVAGDRWSKSSLRKQAMIDYHDAKEISFEDVPQYVKDAERDYCE